MLTFGGCAQEDEESEEGEVIEAPREQDDDYDSIDEYDDDGYKGPEDRENLLMMREIEREEVLTQRFDRKEKRREKLEVRWFVYAKASRQACHRHVCPVVVADSAKACGATSSSTVGGQGSAPQGVFY